MECKTAKLILMRKRKINQLLLGAGFLILFLIFGAVQTFGNDNKDLNTLEYSRSSQQHTVTGVVTDAETGESLPGVSIIIRGTTIGTTTGIDGRYTIDVTDPSDVLVFSFVGFRPVEVQVGEQRVIDVSMTAVYTELDEIVVVGYGSAPKRTLTGATSAITGAELESVPVTNLAHNLAGKLPGLVLVNISGEPGRDNSIIRIRGEHTLNNNNPLIVIDGIPDRAGGLDRLNPNDIENISVLKDASAAIYGAQAANGVILITTKRGREGPTQFRLDVNQGLTQPTGLPEMASAAQYMTMLNEINYYRGNPPRYTEARIQEHANPTDPWIHHNTDWFAEAIKPFSAQSMADLSVSGGSQDIKYYLSFGALTEDGFFKQSATHYNQYSFRSNIDGQITNSISLGFDVSGRYEDRNYPGRDNPGSIQYLVRGKPNFPGFWPNGLPGPAQESGGQNPVVTGSDVTGFDDDNRYYVQTNLRLTVDIPGIEGLQIRANASFDKDNRDRKAFQKPWMLYNFDEASYRALGGDPEQYLEGGLDGPISPRLSISNTDGYDLMTNIVGEYTANLEDHGFRALVGTEFSQFERKFLSAYRQDFISVELPELFAGATANQTMNGYSSMGRRLNYFSRINYDYQEKYLLELVGRLDGSHIFPEGRRFGFFPAISAAWRLTEEDWFSDFTGFFDELKLRVSYGQTGNDRIEPYQYLASFGFSQGYNYSMTNEVVSINEARFPNPIVTWEVAHQFDVGVEANMFDHRFRVELDYFDYLRTDILHFRRASVPYLTGMELPRENIGEVKSWGFDGTVTWREQVNRDFFYRIVLNGGWATNEIKFWDEEPGVPDWQMSTGSKMRAPLMYVADGVFETQADVDSYPSWPGARPGDIRFADTNGDGVIDASDRVRQDYNDIPEWQGGLSFSGIYKNIDFTVFFQGAAGAVTYVQTASGEFGNYYKDFADNRWTEANPNDHTPRTFNRQDEYWMDNMNTYWQYSTDYLRLKNLEIGYTLPTDISNRVGIDRFRVYVNAYNVFTWTPFPYGDPETAREDRGGNYPQLRVFNLGLSTTF
jgi:TonB-dependent starch-binding outer membrane protein SusC